MVSKVTNLRYFCWTGQSHSGKRAMYEPSKCQQLVCSPRKTIFIVSLFVGFIVLIALIAAFARPGGNDNCHLTTPPPESVPIPVTVPTATNGEVFPWTAVLLPVSVVPSTYDLFMWPNLTTFRFTGKVSMLVVAVKDTDFVVFHSKELKLLSKSVYHVESQKPIEIIKDLEYVTHEQIYLKLTSPLVAKQHYRLNVEFEGNLTDSLAGFYRSSYETRSGEKRY